MSLEKIKLGELPLALLEGPFSEIRHFGTSFIFGNKLIGSGTFVRLDGEHYILTARHVWSHIKKLVIDDSEIGIQIADYGHRFTVPFKMLTPAIDLQPKSDAFGPDIELVKIPLAKLGDIKARKSFYDLSLHRRRRHAAAKDRLGVFLITGFPEELSNSDSTPENTPLKLFMLGMILGKDRTRKRNGFDYWELETQSTKNKPPRDYGGVSGAGVWKVVLKKKRSDPLSTAKLVDFYLCGVAFYQSGLRKGWRFLRAHGPDTIYKIIPRLARNFIG